MKALEYCKALSHPARLRLVSVLARHELNVNEVVGVLGLSQSQISRHLKVLAESGLVRSRRDGQWVFYRTETRDTARDFLAALSPLLEGETIVSADAARADQAVEDRARDTARFFNEVAEHWESMRAETMGGFPLNGELARRLPDCDCAVDLGCGLGDLLDAMNEKASRVIGVDNSQKMVAAARNRTRADVRLGDLEHLPMRDNEVDAAVVSLVLHHLSRPEQGLAEAGRALAPGGTLVLADFCKHDKEAMRLRFGDRWLGLDPDHIAGWLEGNGFTSPDTQVHSLPSGLNLFIMTATKA